MKVVYKNIFDSMYEEVQRAAADNRSIKEFLLSPAELNDFHTGTVPQGQGEVVERWTNGAGGFFAGIPVRRHP